MTDIGDFVDDARDAALDFVNGEEREIGHVVLGVVVTAGFALAATLLANKALQPRLSAADIRSGARPVTERAGSAAPQHCADPLGCDPSRERPVAGIASRRAGPADRRGHGVRRSGRSLRARGPQA
jgi:hypothetical protein